MIKVSVMYPHKEGARFDHAYQPVCHIYCDSIEAFQAGMGPHMKELGGMPSTSLIPMIRIRECTAADFDNVVALLRQLWPGTPLDLGAVRSTFERALASPCQLYLCAESDQKVVGFGSLTTKSTLWNEALVGYVDEMVVDEGHRGKGIGSEILDHLTRWARDQGCNCIELDSAFHRKETHVFYERHGFQSYAYLYSKSL